MTSPPKNSLPIDGLAVCYTTFNSMNTLLRSLEAAKQLASRIVAVDSGSTDGTLELLKEHGITAKHGDWTNPPEMNPGSCA